MKILKIILKWFGYLLLVPLAYLLISLVLTFISIDRKEENPISNKTIYLTSNGVHLDIVLATKDIDSLLLSGLDYSDTHNYLSFGWGDENFYLNTPTWNDLTFSNAFKALFLKSPTLIHLSPYKAKRNKWIEIKLSEPEFLKITSYLQNTFETNAKGMKILLPNKGYSSSDNFYKSKGSYSCLNTCNSWINTAFKQSGLKSCLWTPFDFGLMNKYE